MHLEPRQPSGVKYIRQKRYNPLVYSWFTVYLLLLCCTPCPDQNPRSTTRSSFRLRNAAKHRNIKDGMPASLTTESFICSNTQLFTFVFSKFLTERPHKQASAPIMRGRPIVSSGPFGGSSSFLFGPNKAAAAAGLFLLLGLSSLLVARADDVSIGIAARKPRVPATCAEASRRPVCKRMGRCLWSNRQCIDVPSTCSEASSLIQCRKVGSCVWFRRQCSDLPSTCDEAISKKVCKALDDCRWRKPAGSDRRKCLSITTPAVPSPDPTPAPTPTIPTAPTTPSPTAAPTTPSPTSSPTSAPTPAPTPAPTLPPTPAPSSFPEDRPTETLVVYPSADADIKREDPGRNFGTKK